MEVIRSVKNAKVKEAVKLIERRSRDEKGLFLIEGMRELSCALREGLSLYRIFYSEEFFRGAEEKELVKRAVARGAEAVPVTASVFQKMVYRETSFGLLGVARQVKRGLDDIPLSASPLLIIVENIEKPGNLGAVLRSADGAGADGVIICGKSTDLYNPNVVRASMGALFTVPAVESTAGDAVAWMKQKGIAMVATTPHAKKVYYNADLRGACAILMGSEHEGLSDALLNAASLRVMIPMKGRTDSLNLSAAAAVVLYEAVRQRNRESR